MKILIIFNINSDEKGIALNSAKTIYEIITYYKFIDKIDILFFNNKFEFFLLDKKFIFCNTIEDFSFQYQTNHQIIDYINFFKNYNMLFLTTHGQLGEDGYIQKILEEHNIPYIGPSSFTAKNTFNKLQALHLLWNNGICNNWFALLIKNNSSKTMQIINQLLEYYKKLCIKPNNGGSSIGVFIITNLKEAKNAINFLLKNNYEILIEEYHEGIEFSISTVGNIIYEPIGIKKEGIFSYDKKYFPNNEIIYESPFQVPYNIINEIKNKAFEINYIFKSEFYLRIDGFYNPKNGNIIFTDINSIPGFQLNGLFFKNKDHFNIMNQIFNIFFKKYKIKSNYLLKKQITSVCMKKKNIFVLFGGDSSENNISVISGSNIIFNLIKYNKYNVYGILLYKNQFHFLNYAECFQTSIKDFKYILEKNKSYSLDELILLIKKNNASIFLGLHGGIGENGYLQKIFTENNIFYTGNNEEVSKLCMNKYNTIEFLKKNIHNKDILKHIYFTKDIFIKDFKNKTIQELTEIWESAQNKNKKKFLKPNDDGCSVGAILITSLDEFLNYWRNLTNNNNNMYKNIILSKNSEDYLLCEYIQTDEVYIQNNNIIYNQKTGWIEATIGFLNNQILKSSMTLSKNGTLTMEEKFLYGTGINFTPIPHIIMEDYHNHIIEKVINHIINIVNIKKYCRIDFFYNIKEEKVNIIEINTLPALTPATVFFQQTAYFSQNPLNVIKTILEKK